MRLNGWNLAVAGLAASWGFVSVIVAGVDLPAAALVFWRCAVAAVTVPVLVVAIRRVRLLAVEGRRPQVLGLALLVALPTAQAAGLLAYLDPVSASFLAWAILGQDLGWQIAVGGLAVLAGGALVVLYEEVPELSPEAPAV